VSEYATLLEVPERPIAEWTRIPNDGELFRDGTDLYMGDGSTAAASLTAFGGGGGGGVTDHGALTGLGDDDHTQYHNNARGDARYSLTSHTHAYADITGKPSTFTPSSHTHTASEVTDFNSVGDARWAALAPISLLNYTGGSVATTSTSLADIDASAALTFPSTGFYEFEFFLNYNSAATTTGAFFSVNGTATHDYFTADLGYSTLATDRGSYQIGAFNAGVAMTSSLVTSGNNCIIQGRINVTATGTIYPRSATEVGGSAITVTAIKGYIRKLN